MTTTKTRPVITQTVERVTPAIARKMLEHNVGNRALRRARINRYAREMERGQWLDARDPIRFDWNGRLADGQHRLAAIVEWGGTMDFLVIRGLDPAAFKVMDQGLGRSGADALGADVTNGKNKVAITRLYLTWAMDGDPRDRRDIDVISRLDVAEFYHDNEALVIAATSTAAQLYDQFAGGNRSAWGAFAMRAWDFHKSAADEFLEGVYTGAGLPTGSAILALRNFVSNNRRLPSAGHHLALIVKAWNDWMTGKTRTVMAFRADEAFPVMRKQRALGKQKDVA